VVQDFLSSCEVGRRNLHFNVKPSRSEQSFVQVVSPICRSQHDHSLILMEPSINHNQHPPLCLDKFAIPVHLRQKLVDGLICVRVQHGSCPFGTHRINFVDENHTRCSVFCSLCNYKISVICLHQKQSCLGRRRSYFVFPNYFTN